MKACKIHSLILELKAFKRCNSELSWNVLFSIVRISSDLIANSFNVLRTVYKTSSVNTQPSFFCIEIMLLLKNEVCV